MKTTKKAEWKKSGTTTAYKGGYEWSESALSDGWGSEATEQEIKFLCQKVIEGFHNKTNALGSSAYWAPYTSEVIHDINEPAELVEQYEQIREDEQRKVWDCFCNGDYHTDNLLELTGQESGIVIYTDSNGSEGIVFNWSHVEGFPRLAPAGLGVIGLGESMQRVEPERSEDIAGILEDVTIIYANDEPMPEAGKVYRLEGENGVDITIIAPADWN